MHHDVVSIDDSIAQKKQLRLEYKQVIAPKIAYLYDYNHNGMHIAEYFFASDLFVHAQHILCYAAQTYEYPLWNLFETILAAGKKIALPCIECVHSRMHFYYWNVHDTLVYNRYNILEPSRDAISWDRNDVAHSLLIVPGFFFDFCGNRVGHGKGYYDRFLQTHAIDSVSLCFSNQIRTTIIHNEHDMPVDCIITENGIYETQKHNCIQ